MSQYFSLKRMGRLLRKQLVDYFANYLLGMGVLLGGLLLLMGGIAFLNGQRFPVGAQAAFFAMLLLVTGAFFTSTVFAALGDKRQAASLLTLPASTLEKYLAGWVLSLPGFGLVYTAAFYAADGLLLWAVRLRGWPTPLLNIFSAQQASLAWLLVCYPLLHGYMLYGSLFFRKNQFVRTAALGLLGLLVLALVNWRVMSTLLGVEVGLALPFGTVNVHTSSATYEMVREVSVSASQLPWLGALPLVLATMLWVAAYFRFAETQI